MKTKKEFKVVENRPHYENKEAEQEALGRGAMKLALIGEKYKSEVNKNSA